VNGAPVMRRLWVVVGMAGVTALAGCHHRQQAVYQPPPPPVQQADVERPARPVRPEPGNGAGTARPLVPGEQPETHGRPVSSEVGIASWYGPPYHNRHAADGSIYDQNAMTAAHRTLPMGSVVRVTNLTNNQAILTTSEQTTKTNPNADQVTLERSMPLASLEPGKYQITIKVNDGISKQQIAESAPFVVD